MQSQRNGPVTILAVTWGGPGYEPVPGDFDGDGKADCGLYETATGRWRILTSSSGYLREMTVMLGGAPSAPVAGDYDGDGRIDPAVYDAAAATWTVRGSRSNYTTSLTRTVGGPGFLALPRYPQHAP